MEATLSQGEHWSSDNHTSTPTSLFHASVQLHPDTATSSLYVSPTYTLATLIPSGFSPSAASDSSFAFQTLFAPFPRLHSSWQLPMNARSKRHQRRRGSMALTMLRWRRSQYPRQGVRRHGNGRESTSSMQGVGECMHPRCDDDENNHCISSETWSKVRGDKERRCPGMGAGETQHVA